MNNLRKAKLFTRLLFINLWRSITSISFYDEVYSSYKGYGIKYCINLSFLSAILCSGFILNFYVEPIREYLSDGTISSEQSREIDYILNQIPEIDYDGKNISTENAVILYGFHNREIVAIDPKNELPYRKKIQIPIILESNKIILNIIDRGVHNNASITFGQYEDIFDSDPLIAKDSVINVLARVFDKLPFILIYLMPLILSLVIILNVLIEKVLLIALLYISIRVFRNRSDLESCIRCVLFASGGYILLKLPIVLLLPIASKPLWFLQNIPDILMIAGIVKSFKRLN